MTPDELAEMHAFAHDLDALVFVYHGMLIWAEDIKACNGNDDQLLSLIRSIQNVNR